MNPVVDLASRRLPPACPAPPATPSIDAGDRILRLPAVRERVGLSRSSIYRGINARTFPAPVQLGVKAIGWRESDVNAWIAGGGVA